MHDLEIKKVEKAMKTGKGLELQPNRLVLGLAFVAIALGGCRKGGSLTSESVRSSPEGTPCPAPGGMIADGDDNNNQVNVVEGRGGYWYTFVDEAGSDVWPTAGSKGGTFEMSPGGANGTQFAAHMKGTIGTGNIVYVGMGMNFVDPKGPYDASKYQGVTFWAKKGPGSTGNVRLKMPDNSTDPDGGVCSECFNDFGVDMKLTEEWTQYTLLFDNMSQQKGWGSPRKSDIDKASVYGIQFQVNDKGQPFDIWVDNIQFTGCGGG